MKANCQHPTMYILSIIKFLLMYFVFVLTDLKMFIFVSDRSYFNSLPIYLCHFILFVNTSRQNLIKHFRKYSSVLKLRTPFKRKIFSFKIEYKDINCRKKQINGDLDI